MYPLIFKWLTDQGFGSFSVFMAHALILAGALILAVVTHLVVRKILLVRLTDFVKKSDFKWDDTLLREKVFGRIFYLVPFFILYLSASALPEIEPWIQRPAFALMILIGLLVVNGLLNAFVEIYRTFEASREMPIKGYVQVVKIILFTITGIFIVGSLMNRSPWGLLTGLGAMTAVLLIVFKDSILGLVAGFQFASNRLVHIGDWITMPKYGADGDVIDITLNTVKVRNFDKTISTIPTYSMVSDSFQNWRGMQESSGRRIKRSVYVDVSSIKFCSEEMIRKFENYFYLKDYIGRKKNEITTHNEQMGCDPSDISGRRMTNIGTFRAYILSYLRHHPMIHPDMTFLVRQLEPTPHGLPLQVYVFSRDKVWVNYEGIQSDIFDHILAVAPEFGLRIFQNPTGYDFRKMAESQATE